MAVAAADVRRDADAQVERCLPELVVLRLRLAAAVGELGERDRAQTELLDALELRYGIVNAGSGNDGAGKQAIRRDGAVFLAQERVVRLEHGDVRVAVTDGRASAGAGVEHLGVDAVAVLLLETLDGGAAARAGSAVLVPVREPA